MLRILGMVGLTALATSVFLAGTPAQAQYYPAPVASYYAPAPVPVVSYYAPARVVTYAAPVTAYYGTTTYVQPRLLRPGYAYATSYYAPVVPAPAVTTTTYVAPRLFRPRVYVSGYYAPVIVR